jgi:integrase
MNEKRIRGSGRVFRRGATAWIQYYAHGHQVRESTGIEIQCEADEKKVEKMLRKKLGEVEAGIHRDTRRITYEDLREAYFDDYQTNGRKSLRFDKQGIPYLDKVTRLNDFFSGFKSSEIDADLIRKFIVEQQRKGLSNGSINRSVAALRRMFNISRRDGKIRDIPYFPMLKESAPRQGFFEAGQYQDLSRALPDYLRLPLALGYFTAMRLGEILALEWSQVDFLGGSINLRAGETKNDEARTIPIVPQLRTLLIEQHGKRQTHCPYVCFRLNPNGHATEIGSFRKVWQSRCVKLGLGKMEPAVDGSTGEPLFAPRRGPHSKPKMKMVYHGMIFHDLRRTGVRNLVRAGVPEKVAQTISGHKTRSVFARYNIVSQNDVAEAGRKLAAFHGLGDNSGTNDTEQMHRSTAHH